MVEMADNRSTSRSNLNLRGRLTSTSATQIPEPSHTYPETPATTPEPADPPVLQDPERRSPEPVTLIQETPPSPAVVPLEREATPSSPPKVSDKEAKETLETLSKAYNHAQLCGGCNEQVGQFIEDIVNKLGVRLPRVQQFEDICDSGVGPSTKKTYSTGPGSVSYYPKESDEGYAPAPSPSALLLSAEELKEKCRLKDSMIEILAEELAILERRGLWNAHNALQDLVDYPNPSPIDFNRQTLCKFLNNEPIDGFDDVDENGKERFATNPLGLTVVRQVGPDALLVKWVPVLDPGITCYEIFVNGLLFQRILSPGRSKTLLHPIDLNSKLKLTLNALSYTGERQESASVSYKA